MTQTHCRHGHKLTEANLVIERVKGHEVKRCGQCRYVQYRAKLKRIRHPAPPRLTCRSGRHPWVPENWYFNRGPTRISKTCRACRIEAGKRLYPTYAHIPCLAVGCGRMTWRSDATRDTYLCPSHRADPPPWIAAAGLRIVGTEIKAA